MLFSLCLLLAPCAAQVPHPPQRPDIDAAYWFNNPTYRIWDNRKVVLFFFEVRERGEVAEATAKAVEKLNRLTRRKDVVVIGLTADSRDRVEEYVKQRRIRFTVGAGSGSARGFGIRKLPALLVVARSDEKLPEPAELDALDILIPLPPRQLVPASSDPGELTAFIESDADGMDRASVVRRLYGVLGSKAFIQFADQRLPLEPDPWVRGNLKFFRDLASGTPRDDDQFTPSASALRAFKDAQNDPQWAVVRDYLSHGADRKNAEHAYDIYLEHGGDVSADTLIRRFCTEDLWKAKDRGAAREYLLTIVQADPDASIRMIATMALGDVCVIGDTQAAELLESLAEAEPNIIKTKPMMEYVAHYLQTGSDDTQTMSPGP